MNREGPHTSDPPGSPLLAAPQSRTKHLVMLLSAMTCLEQSSSGVRGAENADLLKGKLKTPLFSAL